jgi:hypothetical protein
VDIESNKSHNPPMSSLVAPSLVSRALPVLLPLGLFGLPACDSGDAGDDAATEGGDTHADHGGDSDSDGADPDTMVEWVDMPPSMVAVGEPVTATFMVHTTGELHIAELRACSGAGVADCGLGDMESFVSGAAMMTGTEGHTYSAEVALDAGTWTVVAYSHVGPSPFVSEAVDVTVQ